MSKHELKQIAHEAIAKILDRGLANSTFREQYPEAYSELCFYRLDMEADVESVLRKWDKKKEK